MVEIKVEGNKEPEIQCDGRTIDIITELLASTVTVLEMLLEGQPKFIREMTLDMYLDILTNTLKRIR